MTEQNGKLYIYPNVEYLCVIVYGLLLWLKEERILGVESLGTLGETLGIRRQILIHLYINQVEHFAIADTQLP